MCCGQVKNDQARRNKGCSRRPFLNTFKARVDISEIPFSVMYKRWRLSFLREGCRQEKAHALASSFLARREGLYSVRMQ